MSSRGTVGDLIEVQFDVGVVVSSLLPPPFTVRRKPEWTEKTVSPIGVDHRAGVIDAPSSEDFRRSSDQKFVSSPASLNSSSARIDWPAFVNVALTVRSSMASHPIRGSISVDGAMMDMSFSRVTVSAFVMSGPEALTTGRMPATFTSIEAVGPTYR